MIHVLSHGNSIFNHFVAEIRDKEVQRDSMRFRRNLQRMGELMAYELSKKLAYEDTEVVTPLGIANHQLLKDQPVIASVLRAGLPLHQGVQNYFDKAENAFISAYRRHHKDGSFDVHVEYMASPDLNDRVVILCDPMLATGASMVLAYKAILKNGHPRKIHVVSCIASKEGVQYAQANLPKNTEFWMGAVDEELTAQSYIVPGLGDAGDLAFGIKL